MTVKEKLEAKKVELENQYNQLIELAQTKRTDYEVAVDTYEKAVQEIRDMQNQLRGQYAELEETIKLLNEESECGCDPDGLCNVNYSEVEETSDSTTKEKKKS